MTRDEYLFTSGQWLVETCLVRDLAKATLKCFSRDYQIPEGTKWEDGPFLSSQRGRDHLRAALPLSLKTSIELAKAAEMALGKTPEGHDQGKVTSRFLGKTGPRVDEIIARNGIIVQFELWKSFVGPLGYPINEKQAAKYTFKEAYERALLAKLVRRRNELTHEPKLANDPTCREYVEFAHSCRCLAIQASPSS